MPFEHPYLPQTPADQSAMLAAIGEADIVDLFKSIPAELRLKGRLDLPDHLTEMELKDEFQDMGYKMVIWPVSSLRVANRAQAELYAAIQRDGGAQNMVDRMQTRAELYATIGYHDYEALDASIVTTIIPGGMPQRA